MRSKRLLGAGLILTLLAGCTSPPTSLARPDGTYLPDPAFVRIRGALAPDVWTVDDQALLEALNVARGQARQCADTSGTPTFFPAVPALLREGHLLRAATWHAADLSDRGYFSHDARLPAPHGVQPRDRMMNAGYRPPRGATFSETLAQGQADPETVVRDWLASHDGHCQAVMDPGNTDVGLVHVGTVWVADYAHPEAPK